MNKIITSFLGAAAILVSSSIMPVEYNFKFFRNRIIPISDLAMAANNYENLIEAVRKKTAPDKRITLFDVKAEDSPDGIIISGKVLEKAQKEAVIKAFSGKGKIINKLEVFPFKNIGENYFGIANLPIMQIRDNPKHSAQLVSQGLMGMSMRILDQSNDWLLISLDDDQYVGWVKKTDVWQISPEEYNVWKKADKVMLKDLEVKIYQEASLDKASEVRAFMTSRLELKGESGDFYQVKLPGGNKYYANQEFFIPKKSAVIIGPHLSPGKNIQDNLIETAKSMFATPYLWGGASTRMNDCSGFTQMLYKSNGILIPRDADQQKRFSKTISKIEDLKKGDLVFFPGHVGLYIGEQKFIHSSVGYGGVFITSFRQGDPLFNQWYLDKFQGGGRILNEE